MISGDFALPDDFDVPPHFPQFLMVAPVSLGVERELFPPEVDIARGQFRPAARLMLVPEASVNEQDSSPLWKHQVRAPW
jgi:hypothetical protein